MSADSWKTLGSRSIYKNPWMELREDQIIRPDGQEGIFSLLTFPSPGVIVVAVNEQYEFCLVNQYRYPLKSFSWELPGGFTDNQPPLESARRELAEEAGITAQLWQDLGTSHNGPIIDQTGCVYIFLAQELTITPPSTEHSEHEGVGEIHFFSYAELVNLIKTSQLYHGQTIAALFKAFLWLQEQGQFDFSTSNRSRTA